MSAAPAGPPRPRRVRTPVFFLGFGMVALLIAGLASYAASGAPDGLDSATLRGCETVAVNGVEELRGRCIAQDATDHALGSSPLADYLVRGAEGTNGIAGIVGVLVTVLVAGGLFWLLARGRRDAVPAAASPE